MALDNCGVVLRDAAADLAVVFLHWTDARSCEHIFMNAMDLPKGLVVNDEDLSQRLSAADKSIIYRILGARCRNLHRQSRHILAPLTNP